MKNLICIICPRGCQITIDDNHEITGNSCKRGYDYALQETTDPRRVLTSTIAVANRDGIMVPCKTDKPIKKELLLDIMDQIKNTKINAPIKYHQILIADVEEGINVISTKEID